MTKQIQPRDLAEIVTGLLLKPELLNALNSPAKHKAFMLDISEIVAKHCGGEINGISDGLEECPSGENYLSDAFTSPYISVSPNHEIDYTAKNAWSFHDFEGWNAYVDKPFMTLETLNLRSMIQSLLLNYPEKHFPYGIKTKMNDWQISEGNSIPDADQREYDVEFCIGNQTFIEIKHANEIFLGLIIEINNGVPCIHLDVDGSANVLHIHAAQGGFVLTPDSSSTTFAPAELDRYAYKCNNSLVLKEA